MSEEGYKFQVSFKPTPNDPMVNIRSNDPSELEEQLDAVLELAGKIDEVSEIFRAQSVIRANLSKAERTPASGGSGVPTRSDEPDGGPECSHGPMKHMGGPGSGKNWEAYFCPTEQGDPDQCDALFWDKFKKQFLPAKKKK